MSVAYNGYNAPSWTLIDRATNHQFFRINFAQILPVGWKVCNKCFTFSVRCRTTAVVRMYGARHLFTDKQVE